MSKSSKERRRYPRKEARVKVKLASAGSKGLTFEAYLPSWDVSIGGIFLESEFFVPMGTRLEVQFELPEVANIIRARGKVVRDVRLVRQGKGVRSGFVVHFTDYLDNAMLSLAKYFLAPEVMRINVRGGMAPLRFVSAYQTSGGKSRTIRDQEQMTDLIVAWEIARFEAGKGQLTT